MLIRRTIIRSTREYATHPTRALEKDIANRRAKLRGNLLRWRREQKHLMPEAGNWLARAPACEVELEKLYLPSDLPDATDITVIALGRKEAKLREGEIFDVLHRVRNTVKTLTCLRDRKAKHSRGQRDNTASTAYIEEAE